LTITTDATTHVLHEDPPTAMNLRASKALEAAGRAVIHGNADQKADQTAAAVDPSTAPTYAPVTVPAQKLRELTELRGQGLISVADLRAKLLRESF
jgi:hypothetical protein